jgi:DNA-binding CsgD family transcriptional regulator
MSLMSPREKAEATARRMGGPRVEPRRRPRTHDPLTPREMELLRYMAEGYTNKEIARAMVLAEDTVKKGVQMLIAKLGAADRNARGRTGLKEPPHRIVLSPKWVFGLRGERSYTRPNPVKHGEPEWVFEMCLNGD